MSRITALLLPLILLCSCGEQDIRRANDDLTVKELSKLIGMQTFTANVSLNQGEDLYIGKFDKAGQKRGFVRFPASEPLVDARIVLGYQKTDKSLEASYGYIVPSGDWGTGTFTVPQPYTGVTTDTTAYRVGDAFAFLKFEGSDVYLGYWISPNNGGAANGSQPIRTDKYRTSSAAGSRR